ncbi:hypothetical protein V5E97_25580 [Singulisphaera sp. Ch08]|uniref:Transposase n=1 Tax=Singulisphaera sp. Ch08 TaxID=3120278 RepID=A0AAU7C9A5_9BACT
MQDDEHLLTVSRYVERNALRAHLASRAEDWRWGSLWQRRQQVASVTLAEAWPFPRPRQWTAFVNQPETEAELQALRRSVVRGTPCGTPFGEDRWQQETAKTLGLGSTLRGRGRPRKSPG